LALAALPFALFSVLWLDLLRQLSYTWDTREQYSYGWFVPFFALFLFWRRWADRPAPERTEQGADLETRNSKLATLPQPSPLAPRLGAPPAWFTALIIFLMLALLPIRVVHEINQDWPLFTWPLALSVVAITLYAVFLGGGWRWVWHFAFPVCFIVVAVRWPYRIENSLIHGLQQVVPGLTLEVVGWFNIPAFQRGSLVEIAVGVLNVDEACSGIRSLQSGLMAALFMGEMYWLRWPKRVALVAAGLAMAFFFNVVRSVFLTWHAAQSGVLSIDEWHDGAGLTILVACFLSLWALAWLMTKRWRATGLQVHRTTDCPAQGSEFEVRDSPLSRQFLR
jgi:exosortase